MTPSQAVIFDLDGTLLDTLSDIATAANQVLLRHGFPEHPIEKYRDFIGSGVAVLFERALGKSSRPETVATCVTGFAEAYEQQWHQQSKPYDGVIELLDQLSDQAIPFAVLSNKPHAFTLQCCRHFFPRHAFRCVYGQRDGYPRKPDPTVALQMAEEIPIDTANVLYVGDSPVDMQTARAAGFQALAVSWGFRPVSELQAAGAQHVLDHPMELLGLIHAPNNTPQHPSTGSDVE